jgi:hypothetical protein
MPDVLDKTDDDVFNEAAVSGKQMHIGRLLGMME